MMDYLRGLNLKQITDNTLSQLISRLLLTSVSFLALLLITYFQGFNALGSVAKIVTYISFFYLIVDFGLNTMFIKYYHESTEKYIGSLLILRLGLSLVLVTIAIIIASILPYNPSLNTGYTWIEKIGIIVFSLTIISQATSQSLSSILQRNLNNRVTIVPSIFSGFLLITSVFIGAKFGNLLLILFSYTLAQALYASLLYREVKKRYNVTLIPQELKEFSLFLLKVSSPVALVLVFNIILSRSDIFLLSLLKPNFDVGIYSFAYKIFDFLLLVPSLLASSVYPLLLHTESRTKFNEMFKKYVVLFFLLSLTLATITFSASPLIKYIRGDLSLSVPPLQILTLSLPFFFLTSLFQWVLIIKGRLKVLAAIYATAMFLSVFLNLIYIPSFSYFASSAITVTTEGLVFLLMLIYFLLERTKIFQNKA